MSDTDPVRTNSARPARWVVLVALAGAGATLVAGCQSPASSPASSPVSAPARAPAAPLSDSPPRRGQTLGQAAGVVPDGVTVFDDELPAVTKLDPDLLGALRRAATDAAGNGITFYVNSGWRSREYQRQLLREAVKKYGSESRAARWVATSDTSPHVSGDAVDIGRSDATVWLADHGAGYGLCRIYGNEPWHYELRPDAIGHRCPPEYADPTHDPRMQR